MGIADTISVMISLAVSIKRRDTHILVNECVRAVSSHFYDGKPIICPYYLKKEKRTEKRNSFVSRNTRSNLISE